MNLIAKLLRCWQNAEIRKNTLDTHYIPTEYEDQGAIFTDSRSSLVQSTPTISVTKIAKIIASRRKKPAIGMQCIFVNATLLKI
jgi:hypothetical protein